MVAFRALFWLVIVSLFVPFKVFDPVTGEFQIDYGALSARAASVMHLCETKPEACAAADRIATLAKAEAVRLITAIAEAQAPDAP